MTKKPQSSRFEVDQSVRIEELNRDSVIGIANKVEGFAVVLPRKIKRYFNEDFRRRGLSKRLGPTLFAAATVASLHQLKLKPSSLVLDIEYPGYDGLITSIVSQYFSKAIIAYKLIGKNSPAHETAYFTHIGKKKSDGKLTRAEIEAVIKKTTGELLHPEFTGIRSPHRPVNKQYTRKR